MDDIPAFDTLRQSNPIIHAVMNAGGTAEDCAVHLAIANARLTEQVLVLSAIAPFRAKGSDGSVFVWRCPDRLVPGPTQGENNDGQ